jgi:hypothetical protein
MDRTPLIGADHLDLLVTAAIQYRQLISPTTAAFSPAGSTRATAASPREAGQLLLEENLQLLEYSFRPVLTPWTAVEVIKAVHAYQHDTADSPGWSGSAAHHLTGSIERAATQHLPGYAQAPWTWRRPSVLEQPVGLHGAWAPVVPQVRWGDVDDVLTRWMHTAVVVITLEALELLPAQLAPRGGPTFVLAQSSQLGSHEWGLLERVAGGVLVELPRAADWLAQQLGPVAPAAALEPFHHSARQNPPAAF